MKFLTLEQINELKEMQLGLDTRIKEQHNIDENTDLSLEKFIALKTEFFEFANEIESFKYWKVNKGKSNILEEASDTLHFILSIINDNGVEFNVAPYVSEGTDVEELNMNELVGMVDCMISDAYMNNEWEGLGMIILFIQIMLAKCNFTGQDLYNEYKSKNEINHSRQDNNY